MKILFVGVFDTQKKSTNVSQILAFSSLGHKVIGYNYRHKAALMGAEGRDKELVKAVESGNFNLVVYSKCNGISLKAFEEINKLTTTCLWFMDPLISYDEEMRKKTDLVNYFCCDKENVLEEARRINSHSFRVCEGFDATVDKPPLESIEKEHNTSFIGNIYGGRDKILQQIQSPVAVISNAYGKQHARAVAKTKINLNFCTSDGASDRVYKIMAAQGFLLTNDWPGREKDFVDGDHCVIFKDVSDLNEKIEFYLENDTLREKIATSGHKKVQKYTRLKWAERIVDLYEQSRK
jgi:spore maturation protein CgeB